MHTTTELKHENAKQKQEIALQKKQFFFFIVNPSFGKASFDSGTHSKDCSGKSVKKECSTVR
jgi:hypothetical protein